MFPALPTPGRGCQRSLTHKLGLAGRVRAELVSEVARGQQPPTPPGRVLGRVIVSPGGEVRVNWGAVQPAPPALAGELQADPPVDREVRVVLSNPGADWPLLSAEDPPHLSPGADPLSLVFVVNNHQLRVKTITGRPRLSPGGLLRAIGDKSYREKPIFLYFGATTVYL